MVGPLLQGTGPWSSSDGHRYGVAVISWDELFGVLRGGTSERFRHALEQLQAMYRVLSGDYIAPLAGIDDLLQWRAREVDFINLVDQVTRRLTTQHKLYPMGLESLEDARPEDEPRGYHRRYVCSSGSAGASCFSIGVRDSFAQWLTPVWMRFHKAAHNFGLIRQRIETSSLRRLASGGHLWIPLDVPLDASREQMIQALVGQAQEILRVAYHSPASSSLMTSPVTAATASIETLGDI